MQISFDFSSRWSIANQGRLSGGHSPRRAVHQRRGCICEPLEQRQLLSYSSVVGPFLIADPKQTIAIVQNDPESNVLTDNSYAGGSYQISNSWYTIDLTFPSLRKPPQANGTYDAAISGTFTATSGTGNTASIFPIQFVGDSGTLTISGWDGNPQDAVYNYKATGKYIPSSSDPIEGYELDGQYVGNGTSPITAPTAELSVALGMSTYSITPATAEMPEITATASVNTTSGSRAPRKFEWTIGITYSDQYSDENKILRRITSTPQLVVPPNSWSGDRGGTLTVTVTALVDGQTQTASNVGSVIGAEPDISTVQSFIRSKRIAGYPQGATYSSPNIVDKIVGQESSYQQFDSSGNPLWSSDGLAGAGLMQITPAAFGDIWNWQTNVKDGIKKLQSVIGLANRYRSRVLASAGFKKLVAALNIQQKAAGLRPLQVTIPSFTADEQVLMAIRAYNGVSGTDSVGLPVLQEYELSVSNNALVLSSVDQVHHHAIAAWIEVDPAQRSVGDPDYVENVLSQD